VLLLHILLFDRSYNLTYWLNYGEIKAALRRRYQTAAALDDATLFPTPATDLSWRLATQASGAGTRGLGGRAAFLVDAENVSPHGWVAPSVDPALGVSAPAAWVSGPLAPETGALGLLAARAYPLLSRNAYGSITPTEPAAGYNWGGRDTAQLSPGSALSAARAGSVTWGGSVAMAPATPTTGIEAGADWRALKLEREVWRSSDFLGQGLQTFWYRRRYYTNLLSPSTLVNKVSI